MSNLPLSELPDRPSIAVPRASRLLPGGIFIGAAVAVGGLSAVNGGFFSSSWGWPTLGFTWIAALTILLRRSVTLGKLELVTVAAWFALTGWYLLSVVWSSTAPSSVFEAERVLVYAAAAAAALLVIRRGSLAQLLGGMVMGIAAVDVYALGTRLLPERLGSYDPTATYRLAAPVGYWNGLGILSAIGIIVALGLAARVRSLAGRGAAAAAVPVLAAALYFTFSRGSLIALGIALVFVVVFDAARLQLVTVALVLAVPAAIVVWIGARSAALTTQGARLSAATHDGHRLGLLLVVLVVVSGALGVAGGLVERRLSLPAGLRRGYGALLAVVAIAAVVGGLVHEGNPATVVQRGWHSFTSPPVQNDANLNKRFFNLSSNGRIDLWKAGWHEARAHPWLGGGAGSYEEWWNAHRHARLDVLDAHNLYIETLAELGPVGLGLLAAVLLTPLVAAFRARRRRFVAPAAAAYVAYLVHAAADWDWELSGVTLAAVLCGSALLIAGRREDSHADLSWRVRGPALAAAVAVIGVAVVILVGNAELGSASSALRSGDWARAESKARAAKAWMPWASAPWRTIGESQLARRRFVEARSSLGKAIAKDPNDWHLWLDLASASTGEPRARALVRARRLNPLSPDIASIG